MNSRTHKERIVSWPDKGIPVTPKGADFLICTHLLFFSRNVKYSCRSFFWLLNVSLSNIEEIFSAAKPIFSSYSYKETYIASAFSWNRNPLLEIQSSSHGLISVFQQLFAQSFRVIIVLLFHAVLLFLLPS